MVTFQSLIFSDRTRKWEFFGLPFLVSLRVLRGIVQKIIFPRSGVHLAIMTNNSWLIFPSINLPKLLLLFASSTDSFVIPSYAALGSLLSLPLFLVMAFLEVPTGLRYSNAIKIQG